MLHVQNLHKSYGAATVLADITHGCLVRMTVHSWMGFESCEIHY